MNLNGQPTLQGTTRDLEGIRGSDPDPLPRGQVGGASVLAADAPRVVSGRPRANVQTTGLNDEGERTGEDDGDSEDKEWPLKGTAESAVVLGIFDLLTASRLNFFGSVHAKAPYLRWVTTPSILGLLLDS